MGRVQKAFDKDLERAVAIKVVRPRMMDESDALKRFKQELLLAGKVSQKSILRIHDLGEVGDTKFIRSTRPSAHEPPAAVKIPIA